MKKRSLAMLGLLLILGCAPAVPVSTATPTATAALTITLTSTVTTSLPKSTPPPTPTNIPHLMYPYTIAGLRERAYPSTSSHRPGVPSTSSHRPGVPSGGQAPGGPINLRTRLGLTDIYTRWLIDYPSDGLTITGILQIPHGAGPFPVIVLNHGYFNRWEYNSGDGTDRLAETLNRAGYLTVSSDYRSWGGSETGASFFYTGLVADVLNLLASLPSIPQADISRVGMLGHSMGGGITTKILAVDSGARVLAAVLYAPVSADDADVIARWGTGCVGAEAISRCNGADVLPDAVPAETRDAYLRAASDPQTLRETSPIHHLGLVNAPLQIHIGTADGQLISGVPPEWSQKLFDALMEAQKPSELFWYAHQGHSFTGESRDLFLQRVIKFFDEQVKTKLQRSAKTR